MVTEPNPASEPAVELEEALPAISSDVDEIVSESIAEDESESSGRATPAETDEGEAAAEPEAPPAPSPEPAPPAVPPPPVPEPPAVPPVVAPVEPPAAPKPPVEVPKPPEPPVVPPAPPAPTEGPLSAEDYNARMTEMRNSIVPNLEKGYAIDDADAVALQENPREVLPKLAARLHFDVFTAVYAAVAADLPQMIAAAGQMNVQKNEAEEEFYRAYPQLKDDKAVVDDAIRTYRRANPAATREEVMRKGGAYALLCAGKLPVPGAPPSPTAQPKPFVPVAPGAGGARANAPLPPGQQSVFDEMREEFLDEDL